MIEISGQSHICLYLNRLANLQSNGLSSKSCQFNSMDHVDRFVRKRPDSGRTSRWEGKVDSYLDALVSFTAMPATGGIARSFGAHFGAG